jgi:hypothetical protein
MMRKVIWTGMTLVAAMLALPGAARAAETVRQVAAACCGCGCC